MGSTDTYEKTALNTGNRLRNRGNYDKDLIHSIIDEAPILHVAFNPADPATDPFPAVLPMLGCTGVFPGQTTSTNDDGEQETETETNIYLHGYVSSRLFKYPTTTTTNESGSATAPVTISAAILDGLVLSLTPFHNSCNYRSAIIFGHASIITSEAEKLWALEQITENIIPKRWNGSRVPPTKPEMTSTSILKIRIHSASAKVRTGGPGEDRRDLKDLELRGRTWTGVVPSWLNWGVPIPSGENLAGRDGLGGIEEWVRGENVKGEVKARKAAEEEDKKKNKE